VASAQARHLRPDTSEAAEQGWENSAAEAVEERPVTKENIMESSTRLTQSGERVSQGLRGVRERAGNNQQERFTALLHHVSPELLRESFYALKRKAAPGVDGVTWQGYATGLEDRLKDLHDRVQRGAYRAQPSRRKWISKDNGKQRPLGIAAREDKIVQQAIRAEIRSWNLHLRTFAGGTERADSRSGASRTANEGGGNCWN
jgi:hypothetical protein